MVYFYLGVASAQPLHGRRRNTYKAGGKDLKWTPPSGKKNLRFHAKALQRRQGSMVTNTHLGDIDCSLTKRQESSDNFTSVVWSADPSKQAFPSMKTGARCALSVEKGYVFGTHGLAPPNQVDSLARAAGRAVRTCFVNYTLPCTNARSANWTNVLL